MSQGGLFSVHSHGEPLTAQVTRTPAPPSNGSQFTPSGSPQPAWSPQPWFSASTPASPHLLLPHLLLPHPTPHPTLQPLASLLFQSSLALASAVPSAWHTLPTCWLLPAHQRSKATVFLSKPFPDHLRETAAPPSCPHSIARDPSCFLPHLTSHRHVGCCHFVCFIYRLSPKLEQRPREARRVAASPEECPVYYGKQETSAQL